MGDSRGVSVRTEGSVRDYGVELDNWGRRDLLWWGYCQEVEAILSLSILGNFLQREGSLEAAKAVTETK